MARPIFEMVKKGTKFQWTKTAELALDRIINIMTHDPTVTQLNPHKPFEVEINTSNYATGTILIQRDDQGKKIAVGYESEALTAAERNYNIYDQEFLSLVRAFRKWRHYLEGVPKYIKVWTDHANLARHREPNILNGCIARVLEFLSRFNYELHHVPGKTNTAADALSRRSDHLPPEGEEAKRVALSDHVFIHLICLAYIESTRHLQQKMPVYEGLLKGWEDKHNLQR